jgi:hypothetical protein
VNGATWRLNREILVEFTSDVDFSTVSHSTLQIVDNYGVAAIGTYSLAGPRTVRFQPRCPTNETHTDGGLAQGHTYRLSVPAESSAAIGGGVTVTDTAGRRVESAFNVTFSTPTSTDELVLFVDLVAGPPQVQILSQGDEAPATSEDALYSYVEFGGDPANVEFFQFDPADQQGEIASDVPLNLYSDQRQQFAVVLKFNQPIVGSSSNVNSDLVRLEYFNAAAGEWLRVPSTVALIENCAGPGATVRLQPTGVVPQGAAMRVALREGFADLTGDRLQSTQTSFATFQSSLANPGGLPGEEGDGSDEILEYFTLAGAAAGSLEDTLIASTQPRANWGNSSSPGALSASFDFDGTGGVGGNFDVVIGPGETVLLMTDSDVIAGGPGNSNATTQPVLNGRLDVRNLTIEDGGRLVFLGPNTASILATGEVRINGLISVNGGDNFGVSTLATAHQPEQGASGQAGGGDGGKASAFTSESTPRGGPGQGAFGVPGLGGGGGETTYAPTSLCGAEYRRGAGGGGGQLGSSIRYDVDGFFSTPLAICQMLIGMDAEPGFPGSFNGTGAVSRNAPAVGGEVGQSPFVDASPNNDFFGTMITAGGAQIRGELPSIWAGAGGGGGGDAVTSATFPLTPFLISGDEKGSGGGGGAGGLLILAIGDIILEPNGSVTAEGGHGGGGENQSLFDRIGGGSGGGSGGHIVMSSAGSIIIQAEATSAATGDFYRDDAGLAIHESRPLSALGGQGGAGRQDRCGAGRNGSTSWRQDGIPLEAFEGRLDVPPNLATMQGSFFACNAVPGGSACSNVIPAPEGTAFGAGGDGSPGIIQLHVSDSDTELLFGSTGQAGYLAQPLDVTRSMSPPPIGWRAPTDRPDVLTPFFSSRSESFSRWIPLGLARLNPDGSVDPLEFVFEGTSADGHVQRSGSAGQEPTPIVPYIGLGVGGAAPSIDTAAGVLRIPGASLADPHGLYRRNALLMREFDVRLRDDSDPMGEHAYSVLAASYDAAADEYSFAVDPRGSGLSEVVAQLLLASGELQVEVVPFFYRLVAGGVPDAFPEGTGIRVLFDATIQDPLTGGPSSNPEAAYSDRLDVALGDPDIKNGFAPDISALNGQVAAPNQVNPMNPTLESVDWDFVRFKVEFDLATGGGTPDLGAPRPGLDFLRIPYRF